MALGWPVAETFGLFLDQVVDDVWVDQRKAMLKSILDAGLDRIDLVRSVT